MLFSAHLPDSGPALSRTRSPILTPKTASAHEDAISSSDFSPHAWTSITAIRALTMDAIEQAQSGHPGAPLGLAPAAYVLWLRHLRHSPHHPEWPNRDRFVLSCGHASMLLYSLLHLTGYDLPLDQLKSFRQWGSQTPGHPERGLAPGVEVTTGPLGQGVGNAVGMAIAERVLAQQFNQPNVPLIDHRVWGFVSDGDLMEGVASEAASLAGHLGLGKLTLIYDDNHITIDGDTALAFTEDVDRRFEAYGWQVLRVGDGNDLGLIDRRLAEAAHDDTRPCLVILRTEIGDPAPTKKGTAAAHGAPLGTEEIRRAKEIMKWPTEPAFHVPPEVYADMGRAATRGDAWMNEWAALRDSYREAHPQLARELERRLTGELPPGWDAQLPSFPSTSEKVATRKASAATLKALSDALPELLGGSADLSESTGTMLPAIGVFGPGVTGRNFHWGVREHGMAACLNGMAAHGGVRPYGSTFLVFADYMKPSIRLAALSQLPVIFVGTHDSIGLGEDGPTHQPVEQLAMLRATPNLVVFRPADAAETVEAWRAAIRHREGPVVLALTRQKLPVIDRERYAAASGTERGAYVLFDPPEPCQAILIATGSEVPLALEAAEALLGENIPTRVVSMPSWELFEMQPSAYREQVLPPTIRARVAIEAGASLGWMRYTTDDGMMIGLDRFGASAPAGELFAQLGFTVEHAVAAVKQVSSRRSA
jgi:transketolase